MLQKRLVVRLAGETVYDNSGENIYEVYKDLWKTILKDWIWLNMELLVKTLES